jgi:hypothetical protein
LRDFAPCTKLNMLASENETIDFDDYLAPPNPALSRVDLKLGIIANNPPAEILAQTG